MSSSRSRTHVRSSPSVVNLPRPHLRSLATRVSGTVTVTGGATPNTANAGLSTVSLLDAKVPAIVRNALPTNTNTHLGCFIVP
jgi:hypothetical protein